MGAAVGKRETLKGWSGIQIFKFSTDPMQNKTTNQPDQISKTKVSLLYNNDTFFQIMLKVLLSFELYLHNGSESLVFLSELMIILILYKTDRLYIKNREYRFYILFN